jgi:hypothetical protein
VPRPSPRGEREKIPIPQSPRHNPPLPPHLQAPIRPVSKSQAGSQPAIECESEELQFLGVVDIYRFSAEILRGPHRPLFARIAAAFALPLSTLFLLHIAISHALFTHIDSDDTALDASSPGTDTQRCLLSRLASDWLALLIFKSAYLLALLLLSLLSVVTSVCSAKRDALTFPRVLSVVPRVWRRLAATFLAAFALLFAYHVVIVLVFVGLLVAADNGSGLAGLLAFLVLYMTVEWASTYFLVKHAPASVSRNRRSLPRSSLVHPTSVSSRPPSPPSPRRCLLRHLLLLSHRQWKAKSPRPQSLEGPRIHLMSRSKWGMEIKERSIATMQPNPRTNFPRWNNHQLKKCGISQLWMKKRGGKISLL